MASVHDYALWTETLSSFESIGAARSYQLNVHAGDLTAASVRGAQMSASAFGVLRTRPLLGRTFQSADAIRGAPDVVILGEDLWASRFARDPEIVGRTVQVGRRPHTVVGVMPSSFRFPVDDEVWLPLRANPVDYPLGEGPRLWVFGRLAEGVTREAAGLEVGVLAERRIHEHPELYDRFIGEVVEMPTLLLGEDALARNEPEILLMHSLILSLLLIVCGNVGLLVLARTATRMGEISIRTALGASRGRIVSQIFTEALVLAVVATGLGLIAAEVFANVLMDFVRPVGFLPYWVDLTLRPRIVFTALGLAVASAAIAGVVPAFRATGRGAQRNLQSAAAGNSMRFGIGSTILIVSEVVLSVGFLAMGGTLARSFFQNTDGALGFEPERYMSARLRVPWLDPAEYPEYADEDALAQRLRETQRALLAAVAADERARGAGMGEQLPGDFVNSSRIALESGTPPANGLPLAAVPSRVSVDFFGGLDRPILAGRDFAASDVEGDAGGHRRAVIVNTSFVEDVLSDRSPIGKRFRYRGFNAPPPDEPAEYEWYEIVGVVGPFGANPLNPTRDAAVYHPIAPGEINPIQFLVETAGDPEDFVARFRQIAATVDPEATVDAAMPLVDRMRVEAKVLRVMSLAEAVLAAVAFLLSVTGLYALMSFTVAQRTREIGIRTALGARAWSIVSTVARRAAAQLGLGLALGAGWAWIVLTDITGDSIVIAINIPVTIAFTIASAALVGIVACASPTIRGLRIPPTEALREL